MRGNTKKSINVLKICVLLFVVVLIFSSCDKIPLFGRKPEQEYSKPSEDSDTQASNNTTPEAEHTTKPEDIDGILEIDGTNKEITGFITEDVTNASTGNISKTEPSSEGLDTSSSASSKDDDDSATSPTATNNSNNSTNTNNATNTTDATDTADTTKENTEDDSSYSRTLANQQKPSNGKNQTSSVIEKEDKSKPPMINEEDLNSRLSQLSEEVFYLINQDRMNEGLPSLIPDSTLTKAAEIRAKEASNNPDLGHTRPNGTECSTILQDVGYSKPALMMGENLVFTIYDATAEKLVDLWRKSEGHYLNYMDEDFVYTGIAIHYKSDADFALTCAQIFAN